jgi:cytochrome c oxidase assembly factor CtaG
MKHLTPVWFGIMLSSGLIAASAIAAPTVSSLKHSQPQHSIEPEANSLVESNQLADVLMIIIAFGLPCSMLFAVLLHNQIAAERDRLAAQLVPIRVKSKS